MFFRSKDGKGTAKPVPVAVPSPAASPVPPDKPEPLEQSMRLAPKDLRSGEILWLGENRAFANGEIKVGVMASPAATNGAAPSASHNHS